MSKDLVFLELLFHYSCTSCERWWTIADIAPKDNAVCPHCLSSNVVHGIELSKEGTIAIKEIGYISMQAVNELIERAINMVLQNAETKDDAYADSALIFLERAKEELNKCRTK